MALLLTSVFGVTGCGSDDDVDVESRVKNAAPEASGASDALSKADCDYARDLLLLDFSDRLNLNDLLELLDVLDSLDRDDLLDFSDRFDLIDRLGLYALLLDQCAAVSKSGTDSPEGDDVDGG